MSSHSLCVSCASIVANEGSLLIVGMGADDDTVWSLARIGSCRWSMCLAIEIDDTRWLCMPRVLEACGEEQKSWFGLVCYY